MRLIDADKLLEMIKENIEESGNFRMAILAEDVIDVINDYAEDYDPEADYKRGLNDAWETARKISKMSNKEQFDCFDNHGMTNVLDYNTAAKAIEKLRTYEEQKKAEDEIKVGDEVETDYTGNVIITRKNKDDGWYVVIDKGFYRLVIHKSHIIKKTGRHFPQVAELLAALGEDGET